MPGNDPQLILRLIIGGAAFGLVLCLWLAGLVFWMHRRSKKANVVRDRLKAFDVHGPASSAVSGTRVLRLWHEGKEATTVVPGLAGGRHLLTRLEDIRVQAGWTTPLTSSLLSLLGVMGLVGASSYLISGMVFVALAAPVATLILFWIYISNRISRRVEQFERCLIDALELAARSLRAGHPLNGSFQLIAAEIPPPVGDIFGTVCQQQDLGVGMDESLREAAKDHWSDDLKLFATSVIIQLRSGGNLAEMMIRLADVIRERNRLARRVRVLTAQTQFSKRVLLAMPFLVFVLLNLVNPKYMQPLYTTSAGQMIMAAAAVGLLLGWVLMNWIAKLRT